MVAKGLGEVKVQSWITKVLNYSILRLVATEPARSQSTVMDSEGAQLFETEDLQQGLRESRKYSHEIRRCSNHAVADMRGMFDEAAAFNQPIGAWNTSFSKSDFGAVADMRGMFDEAAAFNQPIGAWNTSFSKSGLGVVLHSVKSIRAPSVP